ncbi:MAG TPA: glycoside hydrolase family 15 protein [Chloroflexota bacterium]|nr:glycoside hydrolase family 15 protein [Chloroflexota bacterium]
MPRDLPLANGRLLINFDSNYYIRDFYYPYVGMENQTLGHQSRFGVWVDGQFSWIDNPEWQREMAYEDDTLVTDVRLANERLQLRLRCHDVVDFDRDVYVRRIDVENCSPKPREVRLFFHHNFHIMGTDVGDTAYFDVRHRALVHYKGKRWFMCNVAEGDVERDGFDSFATGTKEVEGREGTWRDAEDGRLEGNPIAQGSVDSTGCVNLPLGPNQAGKIYHWICAGERYGDVERINAAVLERSPETFVQRTRDYWKAWIHEKMMAFADLPDEVCRMYRRSLLILRTQIDSHGGILAANDSDISQFARDTYSYVWPRDGALVAYALVLAGHVDTTRRFFLFCRDIITRDGYMLHKYNPDGSLGSSWHPWVTKDGYPQLPVQEDETALVIYSLWQRYKRHHDVEFVADLYLRLVKNAADWMVEYRDPRTNLPKHSWDLWEERRGVLAYTVSAVWAGLQAAACFTETFGEHDLAAKYRKAADEIKAATIEHMFDPKLGRFLRMIVFHEDGTVTKDATLDSSMWALFRFGMFEADDPMIVATMQVIEERLTIKTSVGGVARYENDYYHQVSQDVEKVPGNPWFICTLWLAQWHIARAQTLRELQATVPTLQWVAQHGLRSGVLAEQVDPYTDAPLSVSPLTWSHAEVLITVHDYVEKYKELVGQTLKSGEATVTG